MLTLAGCLPWVFLLTFIGRRSAENWEDWKDTLHYVDYAVAARSSWAPSISPSAGGATASAARGRRGCAGRVARCRG